MEEPTHKDFSENTNFYSHKFHKAALAYEVGISIFTDKCVWIEGPFPAGKHDISIYRSKLKGVMKKKAPGKLAVGDRGYRGEADLITIPSSHDGQDVRDFKSRALSRHETFNGRLKNFTVLDERFRHGHDRKQEDDMVRKHQACFFACAVLVQVEMDLGKPIFPVY